MGLPSIFSHHPYATEVLMFPTMAGYIKESFMEESMINKLMDLPLLKKTATNSQCQDCSVFFSYSRHILRLPRIWITWAIIYPYGEPQIIHNWHRPTLMKINYLNLQSREVLYLVEV